MADWRDGAEYAPAERPDGFATPRTSPLSVATPDPHPAEGLPPMAPDGFQPSPTPTPPLAALVPSTAPTRDPHQAFDSGMTIVEGSAWGSAHNGPGGATPVRDPRQPIVTTSSFGPLAGQAPDHGAGDAWQGSSAPDPATRFAPPTGAPVSMGAPGPGGPANQHPQPLTWYPSPTGTPVQNSAFMTKVKAMGYALVIVLVAGVFISPLSFVLLLAAIPLSLMATVKKQTLMRIAAVATAVALLMGLMFPGDNDTLDAIISYTRWACLVVLALDLTVVWRSFGKGQR
ncbi:hypothetical protein ACSDQ9_09535 [Aestuariimicrobium soli]|uniref:hypothetical protein n=1 Tax=Aestuariimicrobium soli TaxID=2035834 RepID=UPI003EB78F20